MKCAKIEVTVNFENDEDTDDLFHNMTLDEVAAEVVVKYPTWTSIVLIVVRQP